MKNKKRIVGFLVLLEIVSVFLALKSFNNKIVKLNNVMLKQSVINKAKFGLYIEQTNGSYEESNSSSWPTSMILNMERSTCIDEDGLTINNALEWDRVNKKVTLNSNTTAYCYLYFDYMFHGLGTQEVTQTDRNIKPSVNPIGIGGNPGVNDDRIGRPAYATFSDALIFDRALTAAEILSDYSGEISTISDDSDLLVRYKFN